MPIAVDPSSPASLRYSRTPKTKVAATAITGVTGVFTVASGALNAYQSGDLVQVVDAVDGTAYTGVLTAAQGVTRGQPLYLQKIDATTCQLLLSPGGAIVTWSTALTAGGALQFGVQGVDWKAPNIVASGSVAGGAFGTPLD